MLEVNINRVEGDSSSTIGIIRIDDAGTPEFVNPPDIVTVALIRKALAVLEARAAAVGA